MDQTVKAPTPEYLSAPDVGKSRLMSSSGVRQVVVENYSSEEHLGGQSKVFLSHDDGMSFALLDWRTHWRSWWRKLGREWPPHHIETVTLTEQRLRLSYFEATYDGPVDRVATYLFIDKQWRLS